MGRTTRQKINKEIKGLSNPLLASHTINELNLYIALSIITIVKISLPPDLSELNTMSIKMTHNQQNGKRTIKWERIFANYLSDKQ